MPSEGLGPEIAAAHVAISASFKGMAEAVRAEAKSAGSSFGSTLGATASTGAKAAGEKAGSAFEGGFSSKVGTAFKNVFVYGGAYAAISGVSRAASAAGRAMFGFNSELQQSSIAFKTLLGSSAAANRELAWLQQTARTTPFTFESLLPLDQQLIAMGFNAQGAHKALVALGDATAGLGKGSDDLSRMVLALGQMQTKGRVQSQELLQLQEAGIPALRDLAGEYGVTTAQMQKFISAGDVSSAQAIPALVRALEDGTKGVAGFGGMMQRQSRTAQGAISNIEDSLTQGLARASRGVFTAVNGELQGFANWLASPAFNQDVDKMTRALNDTVAAGGKAAHVLAELWPEIKLVGAAWATWKVGSLAAGAVTSMQGALGRLRAAYAEAAVAQEALDAATRRYAGALAMYESGLGGATARTELLAAAQEKAAASSTLAAAKESTFTASLLGSAARFGVFAGAAVLVDSAFKNFASSTWEAKSALDGMATAKSWDTLEQKMSKASKQLTGNWFTNLGSRINPINLIGNLFGHNDIVGVANIATALQNVGSSASKAEAAAKRGSAAWNNYRARVVEAANGNKELVAWLNRLRAGALNVSDHAMQSLAGETFKTSQQFIQAAKSAGVATNYINILANAARHVPGGDTITFSTNALGIAREIQDLESTMVPFANNLMGILGRQNAISNLRSQLSKALAKAPTVSAVASGYSTPAVPSIGGGGSGGSGGSGGGGGGGGGSKAAAAYDPWKAFLKDFNAMKGVPDYADASGRKIARFVIKGFGDELNKNGKLTVKGLEDLGVEKWSKGAAKHIKDDFADALKDTKSKIAAIKQTIAQGKSSTFSAYASDFFGATGSTDFYGNTIAGSTGAAAQAIAQSDAAKLASAALDEKALNKALGSKYDGFLNALLASGNYAELSDLAGNTDMAKSIGDAYIESQKEANATYLASPAGQLASKQLAAEEKQAAHQQAMVTLMGELIRIQALLAGNDLTQAEKRQLTKDVAAANKALSALKVPGKV